MVSPGPAASPRRSVASEKARRRTSIGAAMPDRFKTIIEPFRIHSVEPLRLTTEDDRREKIKAAGYNVFALRAEDVLIDLLTDSGTGAEALDLVIAEAREPQRIHPFKGNMDVAALENLLAKQSADVPVVFITVTNNSGGGQPVSMENIRAVRAVCDRYRVPLFLDACRFAENAWFIRLREKGYAERDVGDVVREMASYADGMTMSAKKDPLANIGGWLAVNDDDLAEKCRNLLILTEGFSTYGGLAGRDLEAIAQGLSEAIEPDYLRYRIRSTEYLADALDRAGVPIVKPAGGHAVYIDARALLPHIPPLAYPGEALAVALYETGGIRSVEIGTVMFGRRPDGSEAPAAMDLVRMAIPRRTYTQSHIDYVIEVVLAVAKRASELRGYRIVDEPPQLRHFTARFEPLAATR